MGLIDDVWIDQSWVFTHPDLAMGVESITYKSAGVTSAPFNAQVFRDHQQKVSGSELLQFVPLSVFIANSATLGRTAIPDGGDEVLVATHVGRDPEWHAVGRILNSDAAGWMVELS